MRRLLCLLGFHDIGYGKLTFGYKQIGGAILNELPVYRKVCTRCGKMWPTSREQYEANQGETILHETYHNLKTANWPERLP